MSGRTLGHYEVLALLGRGGMGEVHRARDTKLDRDVALKLLPQDFALDPERLARFRREAKVLASLHHPNIASIFGIEEDQGQVFLVMELAEGADLTDRIAKGPIPEDEVLDIARQIAAGLEEAHEKGVVHRDLKPANIKVGTDGKVKILDFGLARALIGESTEEEDLENSPTITAAMSRAGAILGTAAYMSPEQARGRKVDRRSDIWAFGVVLYEMLTGHRLFTEETISDTLAAVLRADIEWDRIPEGTSPGMRRLLERCLERDPMRRLRDIGEARIFLESGAEDSSLLASASSFVGVPGDYADTGARRGLPLWMTVALAAVLGLAGLLAGWQILGRSEPPQVFNLALPKPQDAVFHLLSVTPGPAALSPDGTMVVYSARDAAGTPQLRLRRLDSPEETILSGTEGAAYPFWSPDSRFIGFATSESKLRKVAVAGGPPVTLCAAPNMKGGSWNQDGVILFTPDYNTPIHRVSASGGEPVAITTINEDAGEDSHRHPRFLPDGKHYLFIARVASSRSPEHTIYLGNIDGGEPRQITTSLAFAEYSQGHLLTVREGTLIASPCDLDAGTLGDGFPLVEDIVVVSNGTLHALYSTNPSGMMVYQVSMGATERALEWTGPGGTGGRVGAPGDMHRPRISPDGTRAVVEIEDPDLGTSDLWIVELESGLRSRFTFDPGNESSAIWSRDGSSIVYSVALDSLHQVVSRPVEGTGGAQVILEGVEVYASDMSPDAQTVMVSTQEPEAAGGWNIRTLDMTSGELAPAISGPSTEFGATYSPDGRWIAYTEFASNVGQIIVRPLDGGARRWQVNQQSGFYPFWGPDGTTLYYVDAAGDVMAVEVMESGSTFRSGAPRFFTKAAPPQPGGNPNTLHPDGSRILFVSGDVSADETGYLRLVTDWKRGLVN